MKKYGVFFLVLAALVAPLAGATVADDETRQRGIEASLAQVWGQENYDANLEAFGKDGLQLIPRQKMVALCAANRSRCESGDKKWGTTAWVHFEDDPEPKLRSYVVWDDQTPELFVALIVSHERKHFIAAARRGRGDDGEEAKEREEAEAQYGSLADLEKVFGAQWVERTRRGVKKEAGNAALSGGRVYSVPTKGTRGILRKSFTEVGIVVPDSKASNAFLDDIAYVFANNNLQSLFASAGLARQK